MIDTLWLWDGQQIVRVEVDYVEAGKVQITCVDCAGTWSVPDITLPALLADGSVVEKNATRMGWSYAGYFGVCESCQAIYRAATRKPRVRNVDEEHRRLMHLIAQTREAHPDWSLEKAVHACVEYVNDAPDEPNPAFRAYLIEHEL